jgi:hypothetical protein
VWEVLLLIFFINDKEQEVRGIEISANHLKSIREGWWNCTHNSKESLHLWEVSYRWGWNLISLCKLTNMVLEKEIKRSFSLNLYLK